MVLGEVQLPEVDESPGDDGGEGSQAVGRKIQLRDLAGDVYEPVEIYPGQLEVGPLHTESLGLEKGEKPPRAGSPGASVALE